MTLVGAPSTDGGGKVLLTVPVVGVDVVADEPYSLKIGKRKKSRSFASNFYLFCSPYYWPILKEGKGIKK